MKKVKFNFQTKLTFDNNVYDHTFALRCIPLENESQKIIFCELDILPFVSTQKTVDAFGNTVISGYLKKEHRFLDFEVKGEAEIDSFTKTHDFMPCYRYQSDYTKPGDELKIFYNMLMEQCDAKTPYEKTIYFSKKLSECFSYVKNITDTKTTANEAFVLKKGVCQDFSHIMLSLLRMNGIPCRYKAGLASCDGETHSWIDVWDGESWFGYDPTNNCDVNDSYLALSQGRDFRDCAIDRGVMFGAYTRQLQLISSGLV
ncbi:transglutaminase family protein [Porcipelethomonas sp.]|uniref:transglutaminase family protein n=1 Tax=Porcipelethomonas sp. TaxID=2981675 RepID=UPI003EF9E614